MKSSINRSSVQVNDQTIDDIQYLEPYTLYVNPYFVVTSFQNGDRASKHYYMNTQRVATDISINYQGPPPPAAPGAQGTHNGTQAAPIGLSKSFEQDINQVLHQFGAGEISGALSEDGIAIETYYPKAATESESTNRILYWYHPDYLGSVDLVTDRNGVAYEFFLYTPWGEDMYHYNAGSSSFSSPYRFNGKEKDPETGYHYYGARYYQSKLSVWMSVDPLAHETLEPYVYTGNNPVMLVDPDGNSYIISGNKESRNYAFNQLKNTLAQYGVKLEMNHQTGALSYSIKENVEIPSPISALLQTIDDENINAEMNAQESNQISNGIISNGGAFLGAYYSQDKEGEKSVSARQQVNPYQFAAMDKYAGSKGQSILHEATELASLALQSLFIEENIAPNSDWYNIVHDDRTCSTSQVNIMVQFIDQKGNSYGSQNFPMNSTLVEIKWYVISPGADINNIENWHEVGSLIIN